MNLEQRDRALHEFTDALHADSQSIGDLPVSETFGPQQYTLALLGRELRESNFEVSQTLLQDDLLFRARSWICAFTSQWAGFIVVAMGPTSLRTVDIHGKVVSDTEYPGA